MESEDSKRAYLESVLAEVAKSEEQMNRLLIEEKMRRNHNLSRLRDVFVVGERQKWKDDNGLLQNIRKAIG